MVKIADSVFSICDRGWIKDFGSSCRETFFEHIWSYKTPQKPNRSLCCCMALIYL